MFMCKLFKFLFPVLSVYAACVCTLWLCPSLPRLLTSKELQFDYIGAIIGVLSFLVVFTVSWQIINAMEVKKELDNARALRDEFDKTINVRLNDILSNACSYMGDIAEMVSKSKELYSEYFITSIQFYNKYKEKDVPIMMDISKSHIQNCVKKELELSKEITSMNTFCIELSRVLATNDVIQLYADIKREKGYENVVKLLETIMPMIKWNQKIREEIQKEVNEQEYKEPSVPEQKSNRLLRFWTKIVRKFLTIK